LGQRRCVCPYIFHNDQYTYIFASICTIPWFVMQSVLSQLVTQQ
jgi:hypothetical protein